MNSYKKLTVAVLAAFVLGMGSTTANAGWFGASFGSTPSVTLFGQTLSVPVPSVTLGSAAGTSVGASASSDKGVSLALPFMKVGAQSPKLTVGPKTNKVSISAAGIKKQKAKKK
tara:strand:- start:131 stop:472 length:342 start_codon:yes stop_codon:yes gene_type:complete